MQRSCPFDFSFVHAAEKGEVSTEFAFLLVLVRQCGLCATNKCNFTCVILDMRQSRRCRPHTTGDTQPKPNDELMKPLEVFKLDVPAMVMHSRHHTQTFICNAEKKKIMSFVMIRWIWWLCVVAVNTNQAIVRRKKIFLLTAACMIYTLKLSNSVYDLHSMAE